MSDLILVAANENRPRGPWSADDYDVILVNTGERIGRIFRQERPTEEADEWFWTLRIDLTQRPGGKPHGFAASKEAAQEAFMKRWCAIPESEAQPAR